MNAYKIELLVLDFEQVGASGIREMIEEARYPNHAISPSVMALQAADIGQWSDEHPLNHRDKQAAEFARLFAIPAPAASEAPSRDPEALLEIARFTGLRHHLHGVNATHARELLAKFVAEVDKGDQVPQAGAGADDERTGFEKYWREHRLYLSAADLYRLNDGSYQSPYAQRAWEAWQGRAALVLRYPQGAEAALIKAALESCNMGNRTDVDGDTVRTYWFDKELVAKAVLALAARQAGKEA